jgi:primosomal protein N' (replication factor Y)
MLIAKVRFASPLPQLDKEFDYEVPSELEDVVQVGSSVEVAFGKGGKSKVGYIWALEAQSTHRGNLLPLLNIISNFPALSVQQMALIEAVSDRQAGTAGELIGGATPKRHVRVERNFDESPIPIPNVDFSGYEARLARELVTQNGFYMQATMEGDDNECPNWAKEFVQAALSQYQLGKSTLVVLPDFSDLARFETALELAELKAISFRHSSADTGSTRYLNFLMSMTHVGITYGLRGASFSPSKNLGLILVWDDGDDSHTEQASPYWTSREVLLQRQSLENVKMAISSYSPSSEVLRLIQIQYFGYSQAETPTRKSTITALGDRLDSESFAAISNAIASGKNVLVQIANNGWASGLVCVGCRELRTCPSCSTSIWIDPEGKTRCRSCKIVTALSVCACGKSSTRPSRLGSSAMEQQLRRAFSGGTILLSDGTNRLTKVSGKSLLVVATPGAEPAIEGGFDLVLLADASRMACSPRLRALEQSLGKWANAIALSKSDATIICVGLKGALAERMSRFDFFGAVSEDLAERVELALPPATRVCSITCANKTDLMILESDLKEAIDEDQAKFLNVEGELTLVMDYKYSYGLHLANLLITRTAIISQKSKSKKPGERVFRVNMDDSQVI